MGLMIEPGKSPAIENLSQRLPNPIALTEALQTCSMLDSSSMARMVLVGDEAAVTGIQKLHFVVNLRSSILQDV
jgi:hypothetical protein